MNRLVVLLVTLVVVLVGALMFVLGRASGDRDEAETTELPARETISTQTAEPLVAAPLKAVVEAGAVAQPVKYGGNDVTDACAANSIVVGLNPNGDNFLAVKARPNLKSKRIDKLGPNAEVYPCDSTADGQWIGIVYDGDGKWTPRCGVTSPVARRQSYDGPCQSGWVSAKYLELVAG